MQNLHQRLIETNKENWEDRAVFHQNQAQTPSERTYDLMTFLHGKNSLRPFEIEALGDVAGKSLLHLQCHIGIDTLSWARLGAKVLGVDFSEKALAYARGLAKDLGIEARFLESDVYALPRLCEEQFDIVYTSRGVLTWLPDLAAWAQVVARFLKPEGIFFMHEEHPLTGCLAPAETAGGVVLASKYDYFCKDPQRCEEGTYTDRHAVLAHPVSYQWQHQMGDIVTNLAQAGLCVTRLEERPEGFYPCHAQMMRNEHGDWVLPTPLNKLPLSYVVMAQKRAHTPF